MLAPKVMVKRKMLPRSLWFVLAAIVVAMLSVPSAAAPVRITGVESIYISDAYYTDLDGDAAEDDIKILVEFAFTDLDPTRVDLNLWIELPSGLTYGFRVSVYRAPAQSTLNIDCIDMATESGWYTVTMLASIMGSSGGRVYITDQFEFDPPTGTGPGMPTVTAYF